MLSLRDLAASHAAINGGSDATSPLVNQSRRGSSTRSRPRPSAGATPAAIRRLSAAPAYGGDGADTAAMEERVFESVKALLDTLGGDHSGGSSGSGSGEDDEEHFSICTAALRLCRARNCIADVLRFLSCPPLSCSHGGRAHGQQRFYYDRGGGEGGGDGLGKRERFTARVMVEEVDTLAGGGAAAGVAHATGVRVLSKWEYRPSPRAGSDAAAAPVMYWPALIKSFDLCYRGAGGDDESEGEEDASVEAQCQRIEKDFPHLFPATNGGHLVSLEEFVNGVLFDTTECCRWRSEGPSLFSLGVSVVFLIDETSEKAHLSFAPRCCVPCADAGDGENVESFLPDVISLYNNDANKANDALEGSGSRDHRTADEACDSPSPSSSSSSSSAAGDAMQERRPSVWSRAPISVEELVQRFNTAAHSAGDNEIILLRPHVGNAAAVLGRVIVDYVASVLFPLWAERVEPLLKHINHNISNSSSNSNMISRNAGVTAETRTHKNTTTTTDDDSRDTGNNNTIQCEDEIDDERGNRRNTNAHTSDAVGHTNVYSAHNSITDGTGTRGDGGGGDNSASGRDTGANNNNNNNNSFVDNAHTPRDGVLFEEVSVIASRCAPDLHTRPERITQRGGFAALSAPVRLVRRDDDYEDNGGGGGSREEEGDGETSEMFVLRFLSDSPMRRQRARAPAAPLHASCGNNNNSSRVQRALHLYSLRASVSFASDDGGGGGGLVSPAHAARHTRGGSASRSASPSLSDLYYPTWRRCLRLPLLQGHPIDAHYYDSVASSTHRNSRELSFSRFSPLGGMSPIKEGS